MPEANKKVGAGVGIMILRNGQVLLGQRHADPVKASSALHGEGTWTMPGGKAEFGETLENMAKREVLEETGITVNFLKLIALDDNIVPDAHFLTAGFLCEDFTGEPEIKEPDEIVEWRWFPLDQLPEPLYFPSAKILKHYISGEIY